MNHQQITIKEAEEVWEKIKDNEFTLIHYPNFESYWLGCQRINNLPDDEWKEIIEKNQKKLDELIK